MPKPSAIAEVPTPAEVRAALEHMLASEIFSGSPQLGAFLRFVVEAALRGESERIKGYTIAVEVLRRADDFDPQTDPIVRVEATRLRRAMERYYAGPGADAGIEIALERGSYVPSFAYRMATSPRAAPAAATSGSFNGMPTLLIRPFDVLATVGDATMSAGSLHRKLCDVFARFGTINIIAAPAGNANEPASDYQLSGSVEFRDDGSTTVHFLLQETSAQTVIWSRSFQRLISVGGRSAAEDAIITELAAVLLQPYGVIRSHQRIRHLASGAGDPRYRCILLASESFRSFDPAHHIGARGCLERLTAEDPTFADGFSYLAAIYFREYQYGQSGDRSDRSILDRALEMVRRAIELKPASSRAYQMLFGVLFARHEISAAFAAGDKAIALNPYDMTILSDYGGRLVMIGEIERGMAMLARAAEFGTVLPSWHHFYLFLGSYLRGDLTNTVHHANQIIGDKYPLGLVARALAAGQSGERQRAVQAFEQLRAVSPAWKRDFDAELRRFFPVPELAERLAGDLSRFQT